MSLGSETSPFFGAAGAASGGGYAIERSLRFNSADSSFLSRTPASDGNRKTFTWAGWVKRSKLGIAQSLFSGDPTQNYGILHFAADDTLGFDSYGLGYLYTSAKFRDTSAWLHIVLSVDTTNATAADRIILYVNGVRNYGSSSNPTQNSDLYINQSGKPHYIGRYGFSIYEYYLDGYLADIHFIDGQALDPTSFGEFDANGIWQPIDASGLTYGTNGFYLPFSDNSTAAALGTDTSGNGNTWTVNNISVAAGSGNDSLVDVPTNGTETDTGVGGEVRGNYCTWNPLKLSSGYTLSNGNLDVAGNGANLGAVGTIGFYGGKWYWEITISSANNDMLALAITSNTSSPADGYAGSSATNGWSWYGLNSILKNTANITVNNSPGTYTLNDVLQIAFDADAGKVWLGKNGTWAASGDPVAGTAQTITYTASEAPYFPVTRPYLGSTVANFGQRPFAYTAPSGFKAINTASLPAPTIKDPSTVMDVALYTGTGSTQVISGLNMSPDFAWIKSRSNATAPIVLDIVRGGDRALFTSATNLEAGTTGISSFNSDGFTLAADTTGYTNTNTYTYVAWTWDAGSSTVTNNDGSITSSVRANPSAGFSIVTFNGGSAGDKTVGHGLNVAPSLILLKSRTVSESWLVYHSSVCDTVSKYLILNATNALGTSANNVWGSALPTSSVFGVTSNIAYTANADIVCYCFAPVEGYSAFGSYVGNSSADGPFIYTGFRPRWIMLKSSSSGGTPGFDWIIYDSSRDGYNWSNPQLIANAAVPEDTDSGGSSFTGLEPDILSNGFKHRASSNGRNGSGITYIWAAFAESPFKYARAR